MQVSLWPIERVKPYENNPRVVEKAVEPVARSIQEFGWRQPLVVDEEGVLIVGHVRLLAARKLGLKEVPVHVATGLSPERVRAYRLADNKTGELAKWDMDILPIELNELREGGFDMGVLAFDDEELAKLINAAAGVTEGLTDPDEVPEPPDDPITQRGDIWVLGDHRLMCGDSSKAEDLDRLLDGANIDLFASDPPYNVRVEPRSNNAIAAGNSSFKASGKKAGSGGVSGGVSGGGGHHQKMDLARHPGKAKGTHKQMRAKDRPLANDFVPPEVFDEMLLAWFGNASRVLKPGGSFYIWGGYANLGNYPGPLKAAGLYFSQGIVWDKQHPVLTRKDFMGAFELCQPPDTKVMTPAGESRLSALCDDDEVVTFAKSSGAIIGHRRGPKVRVGTRHYGGPLYGVTAEAKTTWCTDGHQFSVRLAPHVRNVWCVYLMRRGRWWRVGKSKLLTTWGLGVKQRLEKEGGEEAWILSTHMSNTEAACAEQIVSARYGIPTTYWTETKSSKRTHSQIARIYERIDPMALHRSALWALSDYHRRIEYPFIERQNTRPKYGRRVSFVTRACNLLPGVMELPVPTGGPHYRWTPIRHVDVQDYSGQVYSLDVAKHHHYIADGMVTHNCFYGWKEGAGHHFYGPNNATDLWHVKKVNPQSMVHLTEKPVELAVRAIQYSSKPGENVLDLFGGSGSTLIGCEQTDRRAFLMEIDPAYCDVIVQRWEQFTGKKAERTEAGTPGDAAAEPVGAEASS